MLEYLLVGSGLMKPGLDIKNIPTSLPRRQLVIHLHFSAKVLEPLKIVCFFFSFLFFLFFGEYRIGSFFFFLSSFQEKGEIFMKLISEQTALYLININYP